MPTTDRSTSLQPRLQMQGYHLDDRQARRMNAALRLTPAVCVVLAVTGLLLASPMLFGVLAALGGVGAAFPRGNLIDRFYNVAIRPLFDGSTLPPAPPPRRFSCALAGAFSAVATAGFLLGAAWVGYLFGTFVILGSGLAATTHWCLGGWIYGRLFGRPGCETA